MIILLWNHFLEISSEKHYIAIVSNRKKIFFESIETYINFYNNKRPHSILMNQTPEKFEANYFNKYKENSKPQTEQ